MPLLRGLLGEVVIGLATTLLIVQLESHRAKVVALSGGIAAGVLLIVALTLVEYGRRSRLRAIHKRLSDFANEGDGAYTMAYAAKKQAEENARREDEEMRRRGHVGDLVLFPVPDWGFHYFSWFNKVHLYLKDTKELGPTYLDRWRAQEPEMPDPPQGKPPLSNMVQSEQTMKLVRLKQALLRKWADEFGVRS